MKNVVQTRIRWTCYTLCWSYIWISHKISLYLPLGLLFVDNKTQSLIIQRKTVWDNSSEHKPFCLVLKRLLRQMSSANQNNRDFSAMTSWKNHSDILGRLNNNCSLSLSLSLSLTLNTMERQRIGPTCKCLTSEGQK